MYTIVKDDFYLTMRHTRNQVFCLYALLGQHPHLIFHQGYQRRDDQTESFVCQRWYLVTQRLAATGGHQHKGISPSYQMADNLLLIALEGVITEEVLQNAVNIACHCFLETVLILFTKRFMGNF